MASVHVYDTIKNYLVTAQAPTPIIDWDTIDHQLEQSNNQFICLEEVFSDEEVASFGDPTSICMREFSSLAIHCYVPAPESSSVARALAEQVQQSLRLLIVSNLRVVDLSPPQFDGANDGLWTAFSLTLDVEMDRHESLQP